MERIDFPDFVGFYIKCRRISLVLLEFFRSIIGFLDFTRFCFWHNRIVEILSPEFAANFAKGISNI